MQWLSKVLKFCFAMPACLASYLIADVRAQKGWARGLHAISMLPLFFILTFFWLAVWVKVVSAVFHLGCCDTSGFN
jgi:hypothetical protein